MDQLVQIFDGIGVVMWWWVDQFDFWCVVLCGGDFDCYFGGGKLVVFVGFGVLFDFDFDFFKVWIGQIVCLDVKVVVGELFDLVCLDGVVVVEMFVVFVGI